MSDKLRRHQESETAASELLVYAQRRIEQLLQRIDRDPGGAHRVDIGTQLLVDISGGNWAGTVAEEYEDEVVVPLAPVDRAAAMIVNEALFAMLAQQYEAQQQTPLEYVSDGRISSRTTAISPRHGIAFIGTKSFSRFTNGFEVDPRFDIPDDYTLEARNLTAE